MPPSATFNEAQVAETSYCGTENSLSAAEPIN